MTAPISNASAPTTTPRTAGNADAPVTPQRGFSRYAKWGAIAKYLPGVSGSMWRSGQPDNINFYVRGEGWAKFAKNVAETTVEGATLTWIQRGDDGTGVTPPDGRAPFWEQPFELSKGVAALPGVTWTYTGPIAPGAPPEMLFVAPDKADREALDLLIRDEIAGLPVRWLERKPW